VKNDGRIWDGLYVVFWIAIFVVIVGLMWSYLKKGRDSENVGNSALEILKQRYARGEITKEEFERMKKDLG
jgi:putative membrane protein